MPEFFNIAGHDVSGASVDQFYSGRDGSRVTDDQWDESKRRLAEYKENTMSDTPNVVIADPKKRDAIYKVFGWASLAVAAVVAADVVSPLFDLSAYTTPALAVIGVVGAGIGYTASKNTPQ